jgi:hypothetical protein
MSAAQKDRHIAKRHGEIIQPPKQSDGCETLPTGLETNENQEK